MSDAPAVARRPPFWRRWTRRGLLLAAALVAALLTSFLSIDLGPHVLALAERRASEYLERPLHIGRLDVELARGRFVARDVRIEGLTPESTPFLTASRVYLTVPWRALWDQQIILEVELDDWFVTIESFPERGSAPRVMPRGDGGDSAWSVTVRNVFARDGTFRYIDHVLPWDITCQRANINFVRSGPADAYVATVGFASGAINIQQYETMRLDGMNSRLTLDGPIFRVHQMTVAADGSRHRMQGWIDAARWPEMAFDIETSFDIARMKALFFHGQDFTATGQGRYAGTFRKYQRGGFEVNGTFASTVLRVNDMPFPDLDGRVVWLPSRLEVSSAESAYYDGTMRLAFAIDTPPGEAAIYDLTATYRDVDLRRFGEYWQWRGIALDSLASGWHSMRWPSGRFDQMIGDGILRATPRASGVRLADSASAQRAPGPLAELPFDPTRPLDPLFVGGEVSYRMTPASISYAPSWAATPETYLGFSGTMGWRDSADIPFRVTSTDWQESDRLLAGVLTAFDAPISVIEIGGVGTFEGRLTRWFSQPRIEGRFQGDALRAWDVVWGAGQADLVIENSYATVTNSLIGSRATASSPRMTVNGRYSLGFPRADGAEEFDARIRIEHWPLRDFRHAFELDDWPVLGTAFAELQLYGDYLGPEGFGLLRVTPGSAWDETFETFSSRLSFDGVGVRVDAAELTKSTGRVQGAAYIGWATPQNNDWGTYSFTFDGQRIPIESLVSFTVPDADLTGVLSFTMSGSGSAERPRWEWEGQIVDLFWGDEGIGQATAHMVIEQDLVTVDRLDVASDRLAVSGSGRVSLLEPFDSEVTLRFNEASIDPYLRFVAPGLSPYTRAIASGSVRISGPLAELSQVSADLTVDRADLRLLDFELANPTGPDGVREPLRLHFANDVMTLQAFRLTGEATSLDLGGTMHRVSGALDVSVDGTTNLAIIQGVVSDIRASGMATIAARVGGTLEAPRYSGQATVTDGRLRHYSFPHSLGEINGQVGFDATGLRLDGLRARMGTGGRQGSGEIQFGGRIGLDGFLPGDLDVTLRGNTLDLRFPEGFRSIVDADLSLTGPVDAAVLAGRVTLRQARYTRRLQGNAGLLGLAAAGGGETTLSAMPASPIDLPITFSVDLVGQRLLVIDDADATVVVSPDLRFGGTLDQPQLTGRVDIDRFETEFAGNRYTVDGYVEFTNPNEIDPYFDIEARTLIRQPLQEYRVDVRLTGTMSRFSYDLSSDPPLTQVDQLALILGQSPDLTRAELRAIESPQDVQNQLMSSVLAQLVTSPITSQVGRVVERTLNVDTFTVTPLLAGETAFQQLPNARVTVGKRISNRVFLTYSRSLDNSSLAYEIVLLEYAQNDRVSWVLSRNQDGTFALDFRVRYRF